MAAHSGRHLTLTEAHIKRDIPTQGDQVDAGADTDTGPAETAASGPTKPVGPRKKESAGKESTKAPKSPQSGSQSRTAPKKSTTTAPKTTEAAKAAPKRKKSEPVQVLATNAKDAERVTVYLDPSDYEYLKFEVAAGINDTLRTLVALMRHDDRLRARVERVVRTAPRGSQRGKTK